MCAQLLKSQKASHYLCDVGEHLAGSMEDREGLGSAWGCRSGPLLAAPRAGLAPRRLPHLLSTHRTMSPAAGATSPWLQPQDEPTPTQAPDVAAPPIHLPSLGLNCGKAGDAKTRTKCANQMTSRNFEPTADTFFSKYEMHLKCIY